VDESSDRAAFSQDAFRVRDLLKGYEAETKGYNCGAGLSDQPASSAAASADEPADDVKKWTSLVPRIAMRTDLPYKVQPLAIDRLERWYQEGMPAVMPQTLAAAAIWLVRDELAKAGQLGDEPADDPELMGELAHYAGLAGPEPIKQALSKLLGKR
jgi:hypothetical protein